MPLLESARGLFWRVVVVFGTALWIVGAAFYLKDTTEIFGVSTAKIALASTGIVVMASLMEIVRVTRQATKPESTQSAEELRRLKFAKATFDDLADEGLQLICDDHAIIDAFSRWYGKASKEVARLVTFDQQREFKYCWRMPESSLTRGAKIPIYDKAFHECAQWLRIQAKKTELDDLRDAYRYGPQ